LVLVVPVRRKGRAARCSALRLWVAVGAAAVTWLLLVVLAVPAVEAVLVAVVNKRVVQEQRVKVSLAALDERMGRRSMLPVAVEVLARSVVTQGSRLALQETAVLVSRRTSTGLLRRGVAVAVEWLAVQVELGAVELTLRGRRTPAAEVPVDHEQAARAS
jgi:hypothetical protein